MNQANNNIIIFILGFLLLTFVGYYFLFAPPGESSESQQFTVGLEENTSEVINKLEEKGFIKNKFGYRLAHIVRWDSFEPGAYRLSEDMNAWEVSGALLNIEPYMKWVSVPEGLRKEQIAERLFENLDWTEKQKNDWINVHTERRPAYREGVYFPDTYLIPVNESPEEVADRFISKFEENFAEYSDQAINQNIKWTTLINVASLIQREANGQEDMSTISGVIWNRLLNGMKLDIDATVQYIKGDEDNWWPQISPEDKSIDSPFNTYIYAGIPPHPIANPGTQAIEAALNPEDTNCFYYLHDEEGNIHCSVDYQEHQDKIDKYL